VEFNVAQVFDEVAAEVPDRECIVRGETRRTYDDVARRTRRLANALRRRDLGAVVPRAELPPHHSGQDHVAVYLHNSAEYLETMLGCFAARVAPFNVNYRYVAEELSYLFDDSGARGVVFHSRFAPTLAEVRDRFVPDVVLWQVDDGSGEPLLEGAEWYESVLAAEPDELPADLLASRSPDDLYLLYTGGTTGPPKGVLWRQADIFVGALGGRRLDSEQEWASPDEVRTNARTGGTRLLPTPPFMHGAAHWMALNGFTNGNTVVIPTVTDRFDPDEVVATIATERIEILLIVGDAFGRPLVEAMERSDHDLGSLLVLVSGGATLSPGIKDRLLAVAPSMILLDGLGASEAGQQARHVSVAGRPASSGVFHAGPGTTVLSADLSRPLDPTSHELGWLAQTGRVPLGYLGDPTRTASTFPVIDGVRHAVPGDRARWRSSGTIELVGRDSATINSGGEKVFAEEVERALLAHPSVADCVVAGRPSPRWGEEVVAVVELADGLDASDEDLLEEAARHVARYKLPKAILRVARVERAPSGKADYRWAAGVVGSAAGGVHP